ncbi:heat-inducible transcriptional repressor HrcA [Endothiovibrio diazotrophicus]
MTDPHPTPTGETLSERAQQLLKVLVERYIRDGQPVGSKSLAGESGLELSPATIRNVMADLESLGLVRSPHTSAGRVPTVQGYRLFVDSLLTVHPLDDASLSSLKVRLAGGESPQGLVESASRLLSGITQLAGVVTLPRHTIQRLSHVEFLPLSERRVLAIVVLAPEEVQNRIIHVDRDYSRAELERAANYLNSEYAGLDLEAVRRKVVAEMNDARERMNREMAELVAMAERAFAEEEGEDYVLAGETNLMGFSELSEVGQLRRLFDAFTEKRDLLHLLDRCVRADGVQIFIGEESGWEVLDGCSVVTAPYQADGKTLGVLGVIGPTRMAYDRVIPVVDITARLLGAAINGRG